jgi:uncharacterized protein (UPF0276 family)
MRELLSGSPGIGWRPELARFVEQRENLGFVEVLAEHLDPRRLPGPLRDVRDRGTPIVVHGLGLSLGGADRPSRRRLAHLARCAEALHSPLISEHIAFVRTGRWDSHHLLPVPHTAEMLDILTENVTLAQAALPVPLALENIATLVRWPGAEMTEAEFLTRLLNRTGAGLLLDLANLWANTRNHGGDPVATLDALPLHRVAYVHVAGGVERAGRYHDTHLHPTPAGVVDLVRALAARRPGVPVLLERDGHYPPDGVLDAELAAVGHALEAGRRQAVAV